MDIFFSLLLFAFVIIVLAVAIPTVYAAFIGAPLVITPKGAIREALKKINAKPGERLYELGAGTGRALIIADREFGIHSIGFELSPIIYWFAKLNLSFNSAKKSQIFRRNAYSQCLRDADIVFCFLNVKPMEQLKSKFLNELKPGTRIVSYSFSIRNWQPEFIITGYPGNIFVYKINQRQTPG